MGYRIDTKQLPPQRSVAGFFLTAVGAQATVDGYYVDDEGNSLGSFTSTIPTDKAVCIDGTEGGTGLPKDAVGAVLKATGNVVYAPGAGADLLANKGRYPSLPTTFAKIGRVG